MSRLSDIPLFCLSLPSNYSTSSAETQRRRPVGIAGCGGDPSPRDEAAQLVDFRRERLADGRLLRELRDGSDASHALRARMDGDTQPSGMALQHERPVPAGARLDGRDVTTGAERGIVNGAEAATIAREEEGACSRFVTRLDLQPVVIGDEDVGEFPATTQRRRYLGELVHQRVDHAHLAARHFDRQPDAARPSARTAVRKTTIGDAKELRIEDDLRHAGRKHVRPRGSIWSGRRPALAPGPGAVVCDAACTGRLAVGSRSDRKGVASRGDCAGVRRGRYPADRWPFPTSLVRRREIMIVSDRFRVRRSVERIALPAPSAR